MISLSKHITEAINESFKHFIEVSVRDAKVANEILSDNRNIKYEQDGSNYFMFKKSGHYEVALEVLNRANIEITNKSR